MTIQLALNDNSVQRVNVPEELRNYYPGEDKSPAIMRMPVARLTLGQKEKELQQKCMEHYAAHNVTEKLNGVEAASGIYFVGYENLETYRFRVIYPSSEVKFMPNLNDETCFWVSADDYWAVVRAKAERNWGWKWKGTEQDARKRR